MPKPCDEQVFMEGNPVMLVDTDIGADNFEEWVQKLALKVGVPTDWHYSGGVAQVLTLGDPNVVIAVAKALWEHSPPVPKNDPMRVLKWCTDGKGLYRKDVDLPQGCF